MELGGLYQFVLLLVLVGMIIGVGVVALDKFAAVDGLTATAKQALGNVSTAIASIANSWLGLIVIIVVLAIIITIMIKSFAGGAMSR
jgi:hypothetical protein